MTGFIFLMYLLLADENDENDNYDGIWRVKGALLVSLYPL